MVDGSGSRIDARNPGFWTRFGAEDLDAIPMRRFRSYDPVKTAPGLSPNSPAGANVLVSAFGSGVDQNQFLLDGTNVSAPTNGTARVDPGIQIAVDDPSFVGDLEPSAICRAIVNAAVRDRPAPLDRSRWAAASLVRQRFATGPRWSDPWLRRDPADGTVSPDSGTNPTASDFSDGGLPEHGSTGGDTYVSPQSFDFSGDWEGHAQAHPTAHSFTASHADMEMRFTIQNGRLTAVTCGGSSGLTVSTAPLVNNGEFSLVEGQNVVMSGRIVSAMTAVGTINTEACPATKWAAARRH